LVLLRLGVYGLYTEVVVSLRFRALHFGL
jgi:hypothetical protein